MDFKRMSDQWAKWRPGRRESSPDAGRKPAERAEPDLDDTMDGDHQAEVVRQAIQDQTKIEEARRRAIELATSRDSGMTALQQKLANEERRRQQEEEVRGAYVPEEMSVSASSAGSSRADFNAELSKIAETGPMELKGGKWVPYEAEPSAEAEEPSEEIPRPARPPKEEGVEISAK